MAVGNDIFSEAAGRAFLDKGRHGKSCLAGSFPVWQDPPQGSGKGSPEDSPGQAFQSLGAPRLPKEKPGTKVRQRTVCFQKSI